MPSSRRLLDLASAAIVASIVAAVVAALAWLWTGLLWVDWRDAQALASSRASLATADRCESQRVPRGGLGEQETVRVHYRSATGADERVVLRFTDVASGQRTVGDSTSRRGVEPRHRGEWSTVAAGDRYACPLVVRYLVDDPHVAIAEKDFGTITAALRPGSPEWTMRSNALAFSCVLLVGAGLLVVQARRLSTRRRTGSVSDQP